MYLIMCISTHEKKIIIFWTILVMQLRKHRFFLFAHGVQLDNGVHPGGGVPDPYLVSSISDSNLHTNFECFEWKKQ